MQIDGVRNLTHFKTFKIKSIGKKIGVFEQMMKLEKLFGGNELGKISTPFTNLKLNQ